MTPDVIGIISMVGSAQTTFARLMREAVAPKLRELGFKGSGQRFELPSPTHWALLGFQRSAWGDSTESSFTVNVTVVAKDSWQDSRERFPDRPAVPSANTFWGIPTWQERIGRLLGDGDHWWTIRADQPLGQLADEVISAIRDSALPEIRRQIDGSPDARHPVWHQ